MLGAEGFEGGAGVLVRATAGCATFFILGGPTESARSTLPLEDCGNGFFDMSVPSVVVQPPLFEGGWVGFGFEGGVGDGTFFIGGGGMPRSNLS